jgi:hypothetical protein
MGLVGAQREEPVTVTGPSALELDEVVALRRPKQKGLPAERLPAAPAQHGRKVDAGDPDLEQVAGSSPRRSSQAGPLASSAAVSVRYRFPSTTTSITCGPMPASVARCTLVP